MSDTPTRLRLGLVQHACGSDPARNLDTACDMIRQAAGQGARCVITQELFTSVYFCRRQDDANFALAEAIPGPTTARLGALAKELSIYLFASLFEKRAPGLFHNTSVVLSPAGELIGKYRKMHIPDDPGFNEKFYFTPGDLGWQVHSADQAKIGTLICWDQWYPEAARLTAMRGADVLLYPTAIGALDSEDAEECRRAREAWITVQRAHAISNGVFVASVNRVGQEGELTFWGSSFVADPGGNILAQAPADEPCVLRVDVDLREIDRYRQIWPFFRDRRIDAFGELTQRFIASP